MNESAQMLSEVAIHQRWDEQRVLRVAAPAFVWDMTEMGCGIQPMFHLTIPVGDYPSGSTLNAGSILRAIDAHNSQKAIP